MKKKSQPLDDPEKRRGMNRREMVQRLMGGGAGSLMVAAGATAQPAHAVGQGSVPPPLDVAQTQPGASAPLFLDPHQKETLVVLAERIVPGSTKAGVADFVDLLLSVDTQENQKNFLGSLSAMDGESLRRYGMPFKNLSEARQNELLIIASAPARGQTSEKEGAVSTNFPAPPELPLSVLHEQFENLKAWVTKAYYSSEIGMRELGWTDTYYFPDFPGCKKAES